MKEGHKLFGELITSMINFIILTIVYIFALAPTAIFAKLVKKHFLDYKKSDDSMWKNIEKKEYKDSDYRQY